MGDEYNEELIAGAACEDMLRVKHWNKGFIEHTGMQAVAV